MINSRVKFIVRSTIIFCFKYVVSGTLFDKAILTLAVLSYVIFYPPKVINLQLFIVNVIDGHCITILADQHNH